MQKAAKSNFEGRENGMGGGASALADFTWVLVVGVVSASVGKVCVCVCVHTLKIVDPRLFLVT